MSPYPKSSWVVEGIPPITVASMTYPAGTRMNTDQSRIDDLIARLSETLTVEVKRWISIDEFRRSFAARLLSAIAMADTSLSASTTRSCFCDVVTFALGGRSPAVGADLASTLRQGLDLATNRSHFHVHPTISGTPARGARTGGSKHGISQNA